MKQLLLILVVAALAAYGTVTYLDEHRSGSGAMQSVQETAFARMLHTQTLRCGYGLWEPGLSKDPQTGQLTGIFYDYLNAIGSHTGIKIVWAEEVGWSDFPAALNSGRIDAMCFGAWPKASEAKEVLFTEPIYYLPINAYVRADDTRFDQAIENANEQNVTLSVMDSELSSELAHLRFPKANTLAIPQLSDASILLLNVASGKADMTFTDAWTAANFIEKNPGKLKVVPLPAPLRLFGHTIPVGQNEHSLVSFLNTATDEIRNSGELEAIVRKYDKTPNLLLMQKTDYR